MGTTRRSRSGCDPPPAVACVSEAAWSFASVAAVDAVAVAPLLLEVDVEQLLSCMGISLEHLLYFPSHTVVSLFDVD